MPSAYELSGYVGTIPAHLHEYAVLGLITAGHRDLICNGLAFELSPGNLMLLNPYDVHGCSQADAEPLSYLAVNIEAKELRQASQHACAAAAQCESALWTTTLSATEKAAQACATAGSETVDLEDQSNEHLAALMPSQQWRFPESVTRNQSATRLFSKLHACIGACDNQATEGRAVSQALTDLLAQLIQFDLLLPVFRNRRHALSEDQAKAVRMAQDYVANHLREPIKLADLCSATSLSPSSLLRAFEAELGISPGRYIDVMRVDEAKRLLAQGATLADAALQAGFSDQSHLTRCFKRYIGTTPGRFL